MANLVWISLFGVFCASLTVHADGVEDARKAKMNAYDSYYRKLRAMPSATPEEVGGLQSEVLEPKRQEYYERLKQERSGYDQKVGKKEWKTLRKKDLEEQATPSQTSESVETPPVEVAPQQLSFGKKRTAPSPLPSVQSSASPGPAAAPPSSGVELLVFPKKSGTVKSKPSPSPVPRASPSVTPSRNTKNK